jgi:hypothetical protein
MTPDPILVTAALNQNFQLFCGEDKVVSVDMTGYDLATVTSLEWKLARSPYSMDADILITKVQSDGIAVAGMSLEITIDAEDTFGLKPDLYYHELKLVEADGKIKVAMTGNVVLRMSLSQ